MGRVEARSRSIVAIPQLCPNSSGRHLQDTRLLPTIRATRVAPRPSLAPRSFHSTIFPTFLPSRHGLPRARLSCGCELLLSNDTARPTGNRESRTFLLDPSDYNVSVIPRDNLSRQEGEAVPREFIDGCSCVPYGAVAVRHEVSTGHVLNRLLVTIKARVRSKTLRAPLRDFSTA